MDSVQQKDRDGRFTDMQKNIERWLGECDEETKEAIRRLQREDPEELADAFYRNLSFGTGGLRGVMGIGTNRMNRYTVRSATQGLALYLLKQPSLDEKKRIFIGFDCRHNSATFAFEAAQVLAAYGIEVYLCSQLRPLALVCFGVRHYQCAAGIMITASHNPPEYNGYKVFWSTGGQILPPHDTGILDEIKKCDLFQIPRDSRARIVVVSEEIDRAYFQAILPCRRYPDECIRYGKQLHIVYTSLHGTGITMVPATLQMWGFSQLTIVEKQAEPDGDFPTVHSPNPEEPEALALGREKLLSTQGDLLLATDPDTDRLGVVVSHQGRPFFFDGNQVGCLLLEYLCLSYKNNLKNSPLACLKTIVTTELFAKIATRYGVACHNVLTGFKYIGEMIDRWEQQWSYLQPAPLFLLGAEESYGYLIGTHIRDKDAIVAAACICEAALLMKLQGKTLVDLLYEIYAREGVHLEKLLSLSFKGQSGMEKMHGIMQQWRSSPPAQIGNQCVVAMEDYLAQRSSDFITGTTHPLEFPQADVLLFWLENHTKIVIRPSGTEPKIKIYCAVEDQRKHLEGEALEDAIKQCQIHISTLLTHLQSMLKDPL